MKAAPSSWRTWMKRIFSWRVRSASMIPLLPSPGNPKMTDTPQSIRRSMSRSETVWAIDEAPWDEDAPARPPRLRSAGSPPPEETRQPVTRFVTIPPGQGIRRAADQQRPGAQDRPRAGQRPRPPRLEPQVGIVHLGIAGRRPLRAVVQGHLQELGGVQRLAVGHLLDLVLATEAVGDDQRVLGRL